MPQPARPAAASLIHPAWLLRAGLLALVVALLCGYATACVLFARGQWQFVLHPVHTAAPPPSADLPYEQVRFGPDSTGRPQVTGWWLPAAPDAQYRHLTLLVLQNGQSDLAGVAPELALLHQIGVSVFAFDYRGFGQSAPTHPSQSAMQQDTAAAWSYLTSERDLAPGRIIPLGLGLGGSLALALAQQHPQIPDVILDGPRYDVLADVKRDPRTRFLPVTRLFDERFALEPALHTLTIPKLIITRAETEDPRTLAATGPKLTVALPEGKERNLEDAMHRFLNQYAPPTPVQPLPLSPAPR